MTLQVDSTDTIIERVLDRELELGVVGLKRAHRSLEFEPFLHDRVVLVVPSGHAFAGRTVTLRELRAEPLIVMQPGAGMRRLMDDELRRVGVRPRDLNVAMEMGLQESAKSAVEAGFGVAFLSATAVTKELTSGDAGRRGGRAGRPVARLLRSASRRSSGEPGGRAVRRVVPRRTHSPDADAGRPHWSPRRLGYSDGWCASVTRAALSSA